MTNDYNQIVVGRRVSEMPVSPIPGARMYRCMHCNETVWLGPATQHLGDQGAAICLQCFQDRRRPDDDVRVTPETLQELRDVLAQRRELACTCTCAACAGCEGKEAAIE